MLAFAEAIDRLDTRAGLLSLLNDGKWVGNSRDDGLSQLASPLHVRVIA